MVNFNANTVPVPSIICQFVGAVVLSDIIFAKESVFAMAGYSVFRDAGTEADDCFIVEDNICRLIINVKPELKPIKDLLPIDLPPSHAIANTFVSGNALPCHKVLSVGCHRNHKYFPCSRIL